VISAGPYANNLHLAPDRRPHQHPITQFLHAGCSSCRPANSIKALKAKEAVKQVCLPVTKVLCTKMLCCRSALYNNPAAKECTEAFLTHAIRPLTMLIQVSGHNRARQRDKWARLLEEFAALHDEVNSSLSLFDF